MTRTLRSFILVYQPATTEDPDRAPVLERAFASEAEAEAWAEPRLVVPLQLDILDQHLGDDGALLATSRESRSY